MAFLPFLLGMAECWSAVAALLPLCELKTASSLHHLFLLFFSYIPYVTGCPIRLTDTSLNSFDSVETVVAIGQLMITRFSLQRFARPLTATRKIMCLGRLPDHVQAPFGVVCGARQELIHLVCFITPPFQSNKLNMSAHNR